jgi:hypothetical protein
LSFRTKPCSLRRFLFWRLKVFLCPLKQKAKYPACFLLALISWPQSIWQSLQSNIPWKCLCSDSFIGLRSLFLQLLRTTSIIQIIMLTYLISVVIVATNVNFGWFNAILIYYGPLSQTPHEKMKCLTLRFNRKTSMVLK